MLSTTSGDIRLYAIDVDKVKVNTTSGDMRVEPDAGIRAKEIDVTTISGRRDGQRLRGRRGGQHRFGQTVRLLRRDPARI